MSLLAWVPVAVSAALALDAVRLRDRLSGLRRVRPGDPREALEEYAWVTAEGAGVPTAIRASAVEFARRNRLEVLDLVPADLPVRRGLDLARAVDTRHYTADLAGPGVGAGHATAVTTAVLDRAGLAPGGYEPGELAATTRRLKQHARQAGLAVAPGPAVPAGDGAAARRPWLRGLGEPYELRAFASLAVWMIVLAGLLTPWTGLLGLLVYSAVPYIVFAGGPLSPRDLRRAALLRLVETPYGWARTIRAARTPWEATAAAKLAEAREEYTAELAEGEERFLEARRDDCPWCGSVAVEPRATARDLVQGKPGRFTLDHCADCGHLFQNPRLTPAGRVFYARDRYDGLGTVQADRDLAAEAGKTPAEVVAAVTKPRAWLEVGAGSAYGCRVAASVLPDTAFDGIGAGEGAGEGVRRGWVRQSYEGTFAEMVDELAGRYDVVSMRRHLECSRDPFAELDAAVKVLGPGGHLLVEVPDPECLASRLLRGLWTAWRQPEHQHLIPAANLTRALTARGMEIVAPAGRDPSRDTDLTDAARALLRLPPARPWTHRAMSGRIREGAGLLLLGPALAAAYALQPVLRACSRGRGTTYRVLARKAAG